MSTAKGVRWESAGIVALALALGLAAGCSGSGGATGEVEVGSMEVAGAEAAGPEAGAQEGLAEVTDADQEEVQPQYQPALCGSQPYTWLPREQVGAVVAWEEMPLTNLSANTINTLLTRAGYERFTPVPFGARNFRLRYTTQDRGQVREATATVGLPVGLDAATAPLMLMLHGTVGFMDQCAPSRESPENALPGTLLGSQGYVTVAPDYLGMLGFGEPSAPGTIHPYLVGEATAVASLDAVRAAIVQLAGMPDLVQPDPAQMVVMGGSQGGHAAFFVDRFAPHYAPELGLVATVALIPPTDLVKGCTTVLQEILPGTFNCTSAFVAMRRWYGQPDSLYGVFTNGPPHFLADRLPQWAATACESDEDISDLTEITDIYEAEFQQRAAAGLWEELPPWGCYLRENSVWGASVAHARDLPILAVFGSEDDLLDTAAERDAILGLCGRGYRIQHLECAGKGHTEAGLAAMPYALQWLKDRLAGAHWPEADLCAIKAPADCDSLP
jgi:hypothetical protein